MSFEKGTIEEGWILCKMEGLQCSINCPEIKRGSTSIELDEDHLEHPILCSLLPDARFLTFCWSSAGLILY